MGTWLDTTFAGFDYGVFTAFGSLQNEVLTLLARMLSVLGDEKFVIPLGLFSVVLCIFPRTRRLGLGLVLAIGIGTMLTNGLIKPEVARLRPYVTLGGLPEFQQWYAAAGALVESDFCFPSGHTTAATEVAVFLCLLFAKAGRVPAASAPAAVIPWPDRPLGHIAWIPPVIAFLVGCSRVYLMVHYASDVLGGFLIGTFAGICAYYLSGWLYRWVCRWLEERKGRKDAL